MVRNGIKLLLSAPIKDMIGQKETAHGVSHGLGEAGYDIRLKQEILFRAKGDDNHPEWWIKNNPITDVWSEAGAGRFCIASAIEEFDMPGDLMGIVHDKSSWARKGLSVFNTVIEPGFKGGLTLELVYHGMEELHIPAGAGIAQVIFHELSQSAWYNGKYQFQSTDPEPARKS